MRFFLGAPDPGWLGRAGVPLCVSRRRFAKCKRPRAVAPWMLDSGGFTELSMHGRWTIGASEYAVQAREWFDSVGNLEIIAPQDWMCEPVMLEKTGLTVLEHQRRTVDNLLELRSIEPSLPWMPVLQGWSLADYLRCVDLYAAAGVDLRAERRVGLGSVCRRQAMDEAVLIVSRLAGDGLSLHGFGIKRTGLRRAHELLGSADSMAWSYDARRMPPLPGHEARHINCANCLEYALRWRARTIAQLAAVPLTLWSGV